MPLWPWCLTYSGYKRTAFNFSLSYPFQQMLPLHASVINSVDPYLNLASFSIWNHAVNGCSDSFFSIVIHLLRIINQILPSVSFLLHSRHTLCCSSVLPHNSLGTAAQYCINHYLEKSYSGFFRILQCDTMTKHCRLCGYSQLQTIDTDPVSATLEQMQVNQRWSQIQ